MSNSEEELSSDLKMLIDDHMDSLDRMKLIDIEIKKLELLKQRERDIQAMTVLPANKRNDISIASKAVSYILQSSIERGMSVNEMKERINAYSTTSLKARAQKR